MHDLATIGVPAEQIRHELSRILSSARFPANIRRREFLRFVVEETLAGRASKLKGFSIALAVFGRDGNFDPQADPAVRLAAARLRRDLDSYYVDAGAGNPVRISIPKGSYVPHFGWHKYGKHLRHSELQESWDDERPLSSKALPSTIRPSPPNVFVTPFASLSPGEDARQFALGISQELISNLFMFPGLRLYSVPFSAEPEPVSVPFVIRDGSYATYVITGSVRSDEVEIRVSAQVKNAKTGQIIWCKTYTRPSEPYAVMKAQADLASEIATAVGQPYGAVTRDINLHPTTQVAHAMQSYMSVLRAYNYRRNFARENFESVMRSLEKAVSRDPDYSDAWAMLGWLHVDAGRLDYGGESSRQQEYEQALQATSRAVALQPDNPLALKALGAAYFYLGRYDDSERTTSRAVDLNPNDPEALAQFGWRLAVRGKFDEGIPLLNRAIALTLNPPGWYHDLIAINSYLRGEYRQMSETAEKATTSPDASGFSLLLLAIAKSELGRKEETQQALEMLSQRPPVASDPEGYMRRHGAIDQIVEAVMAGLQKARQVASSN